MQGKGFSSLKAVFLLPVLLLVIFSLSGGAGSTDISALPMALSSTVTGTIHQENTQDWWQLQVLEYGVLDLSLTIPDAEGQARMWLYPAVSPTSSLQNIFIDANAEGKLSYPLGPGAYLVRVERSRGHFSYQLSPIWNPSLLPSDPGENHTFTDALAVTLNSSVTGTLGHHIPEIGIEKEDWWQLQVLDFGVLDLSLTIPDAEGQARMWLYPAVSPTSSLQNIFIDANAEGKLSYPLGPGAYLVRVERSRGHFSYQLSPIWNPSLLPSDPGENHTFTDALAVTLNSSVTGTLGHHIPEIGIEKEDWWQLQVLDFGVLDLSLTIPDAEGQARMWLYPAASPTSSLQNIFIAANAEGKLSYPLGPGAYLVRVEQSRGHFSYQLSPIWNPSLLPSDPGENHTFTDALAVTLNSSVTGTLGHHIPEIGIEKEDWWQLQVLDFGVLDLSLTIPDAEGQARMWLYPAASPTSSLQNIFIDANAEGKLSYPLGPGAYLVRVEQSRGHFSYGLEVIFEPALLPYEPVNYQQREQAVPLEVGEFATGSLGFYGQKSSDWWSVQVAHSGLLTLHLFIPDDVGQARMFVYQGDATGSTANRFIDGGSAASISLQVEPGYYPVKVEQSRGHFSYLFTASFTPEGEEDFQLLGLYPENEKTMVPLTSVLVALFNQSIDPALVFQEMFLLRDQEGQRIPGEILISQSLMAFQPAADLLPDTSYTPVVSTAITDVRGEELPAAYTSLFTTGESFHWEEEEILLKTPVCLEGLLSALQRLELFIHEAQESRAIHPLLLAELESILEAFQGAIIQE